MKVKVFKKKASGTKKKRRRNEKVKSKAMRKRARKVLHKKSTVPEIFISERSNNPMRKARKRRRKNAVAVVGRRKARRRNPNNLPVLVGGMALEGRRPKRRRNPAPVLVGRRKRPRRRNPLDIKNIMSKQNLMGIGMTAVGGLGGMFAGRMVRQMVPGTEMIKIAVQILGGAVVGSMLPNKDMGKGLSAVMVTDAVNRLLVSKGITYFQGLDISPEDQKAIEDAISESKLEGVAETDFVEGEDDDFAVEGEEGEIEDMLGEAEAVFGEAEF